MNISRMPALFIGHGSPMNVLEENRYTNVWRELGERLPVPRAILRFLLIGIPMAQQ